MASSTQCQASGSGRAGPGWAEIASRISPSAPRPSAYHPRRDSRIPNAKRDGRGHPDRERHHGLHQEQRQPMQRGRCAEKTDQVDGQTRPVHRLSGHPAQVVRVAAVGTGPPHPERLQHRPEPGARGAEQRQQVAQDHRVILPTGPAPSSGGSARHPWPATPGSHRRRPPRRRPPARRGGRPAPACSATDDRTARSPAGCTAAGR